MSMTTVTPNDQRREPSISAGLEQYMRAVVDGDIDPTGHPEGLAAGLRDGYAELVANGRWNPQQAANAHAFFQHHFGDGKDPGAVNVTDFVNTALDARDNRVTGIAMNGEQALERMLAGVRTEYAPEVLNTVQQDALSARDRNEAYQNLDPELQGLGRQVQAVAAQKENRVAVAAQVHRLRGVASNDPAREERAPAARAAAVSPEQMEKDAHAFRRALAQNRNLAKAITEGVVVKGAADVAPNYADELDRREYQKGVDGIPRNRYEAQIADQAAYKADLVDIKLDGWKPLTPPQAYRILQDEFAAAGINRNPTAKERDERVLAHEKQAIAEYRAEQVRERGPTVEQKPPVAKDVVRFGMSSQERRGTVNLQMEINPAIKQLLTNCGLCDHTKADEQRNYKLCRECMNVNGTQPAPIWHAMSRNTATTAPQFHAAKDKDGALTPENQEAARKIAAIEQTRLAYGHRDTILPEQQVAALKMVLKPQSSNLADSLSEYRGTEDQLMGLVDRNGRDTERTPNGSDGYNGFSDEDPAHGRGTQRGAAPAVRVTREVTLSDTPNPGRRPTAGMAPGSNEPFHRSPGVETTPAAVEKAQRDHEKRLGMLARAVRGKTKDPEELQAVLKDINRAVNVGVLTEHEGMLLREMHRGTKSEFQQNALNRLTSEMHPNFALNYERQQEYRAERASVIEANPDRLARDKALRALDNRWADSIEAVHGPRAAELFREKGDRGMIYDNINPLNQDARTYSHGWGVQDSGVDESLEKGESTRDLNRTDNWVRKQGLDPSEVLPDPNPGQEIIRTELGGDTGGVKHAVGALDGESIKDFAAAAVEAGERDTGDREIGRTLTDDVSMNALAALADEGQPGTSNRGTASPFSNAVLTEAEINQYTVLVNSQKGSLSSGQMEDATEAISLVNDVKRYNEFNSVSTSIQETTSRLDKFLHGERNILQAEHGKELSERNLPKFLKNVYSDPASIESVAKAYREGSPADKAKIVESLRNDPSFDGKHALIRVAPSKTYRQPGTPQEMAVREAQSYKMAREHAGKAAQVAENGMKSHQRLDSGLKHLAAELKVPEEHATIKRVRGAIHEQSRTLGAKVMDLKATQEQLRGEGVKMSGTLKKVWENLSPSQQTLATNRMPEIRSVVGNANTEKSVGLGR